MVTNMAKVCWDLQLVIVMKGISIMGIFMGKGSLSGVMEVIMRSRSLPFWLLFLTCTEKGEYLKTAINKVTGVTYPTPDGKRNGLGLRVWTNGNRYHQYSYFSLILPSQPDMKVTGWMTSCMVKVSCKKWKVGNIVGSFGMAWEAELGLRWELVLDLAYFDTVS